MKPEALDALTSETMRPKALEAAAVQDGEKKSPEASSPAHKQVHPHQDRDNTPTASASSASVSGSTMTSADSANEANEATPTATTLVSEVVQTVKTAVDGAIAWAEQKVEKLSAEQDSTGPYTSSATCMPSDLDVIASGILPAMQAAEQCDGGVDAGTKKAESTKKSAKTGEAEDKKDEEKQDDGKEPK